MGTVTAEDERCARARRFQAIDHAFRQGDLDLLRAAVDDPAAIPNGQMPLEIGHCLEYAVYHSPLRFVRTLLEAGADPNPTDHDGIPPLIAALTKTHPHPGSPARDDVADVVRMLLEFGADPNQRGLNDFTALHFAVGERNSEVLRLLLAAGADPLQRTRIEDFETPRELALRIGFDEAARLLDSSERYLHP